MTIHRDSGSIVPLLFPFELYAKNAAEGRVIPDALLVQACHMRAIDLSRRVAGSQGGQPKRDAYDPRNYHDGKLELLSLDAGCEDMEGQSSLGFDEPGTPHPARRLASAMDLERWLLSLDAEDRLVLALRQAGSTLEEVGDATRALCSPRPLTLDLRWPVPEFVSSRMRPTSARIRPSWTSSLTSAARFQSLTQSPPRATRPPRGERGGRDRRHTPEPPTYHPPSWNQGQHAAVGGVPPANPHCVSPVIVAGDIKVWTTLRSAEEE